MQAREDPWAVGVYLILNQDLIDARQLGAVRCDAPPAALCLKELPRCALVIDAEVSAASGIATWAERVE